jgi:transposase
MKAYSMDLRERILQDCDAGMEVRQVAVKYRVSESWVRRLRQRRRESGEVAPRRSGSRREPKWLPHAERLQQLVQATPDATLEELRQALGIDCSIHTIARALRALQLTFKKKSYTPRNRSVRTSSNGEPPGRPR